MPRRKTLSSDSSPPATNHSAEDTGTAPDHDGGGGSGGARASKRRKTSASGSSVEDGGTTEKAAEDTNFMDRPERPHRQTRSSSNAQPTSRKASILSRAATAPDQVSSLGASASLATVPTTTLASSLSLSSLAESSSTSRASPVLVAALARESRPQRAAVLQPGGKESLPGNSVSTSSSSSSLARENSVGFSAAGLSSSVAQSWLSKSDAKAVSSIVQSTALASGETLLAAGSGDVMSDLAAIRSLLQHTMTTIDPTILDRAQGQLVIVDSSNNEVIPQTTSVSLEQQQQIQQQQHHHQSHLQQQQQQYLSLPLQEQQAKLSAYIPVSQVEETEASSGHLVTVHSQQIPEIKGELPELHIDVPVASPEDVSGNSPSDAGKPRQIRERRSTRSLEALFQVTDSELQSMQSLPDNTMAGTERDRVLSEQNKYMVLKDVNLVDLPDTAQIFITSSPTPGAARASRTVDSAGGLGINIENSWSVGDQPVTSALSVVSSNQGAVVTVTNPARNGGLSTARPSVVSSAAVNATQHVSVSQVSQVSQGASSLSLKDLETLTVVMPSIQDTGRHSHQGLQVLKAVKLMSHPSSMSSKSVIAGVNEQGKVVQLETQETVANSSISKMTAESPQDSEGSGKRKQPLQSTGDGKAAKVGKYKCDFCDNYFTKPSVLEKHRRTHTNERPFPCVVCGVSFKTKSNLTKHWKSNSHVSRTGITCSSVSQDGAEGTDKSDTSHTSNPSNVSMENDGEQGMPASAPGALSGGHLVSEAGVSKQENPSDKSDASEYLSGAVLSRQDSGVLEGIRQKIDKNKRQQLEKDWFHRVFKAFDKPSQSELAKYSEVHDLERPNIIGIVDIVEAGHVLDELEELKAQASSELKTLCGGDPQLPILMTHEFLTDDRMRIKILSPCLEFVIGKGLDNTAAGSKLVERAVSVPNTDGKEDSVIKGSEIRRVLTSGTSGSGTVLRMLSTPSLHPRLLVQAASDLASQSDCGEGKPSLSQIAQTRPVLGTHSSDLSADRLSSAICLDSSITSQRAKALSHSSSDLSVSSLPSVFSQSSRENPSFDETVRKAVSVAGERSPNVQATLSSRHPLLGNSKTTAAFSNLAPGDTSKRGLVYQHAVDAGLSGHPVRAQLKGRAASLTLMKDIVEDRIQKIINTNAEVVEKSPIVEMPRSKTRYLRQASDSTGFHTMRVADLQAQSLATSSTLKPGDALLGVKKKLAASLSVGDTASRDKESSKPALLLRPDHLVRRSMSTSALRAVGSVKSVDPSPSVLASALATPSSSIMLGSTARPVDNAAEKGVGMVPIGELVHSLGVSQQGELIVLPSSQQLLAQQPQQKAQKVELVNTSQLSQPQLAAISQAQLVCFSASGLVSSNASIVQTSSGRMISSSPSGGGIVAVQEDKQSQVAAQVSLPSVMLSAQPTARHPSTKIVQGPGLGEIQIQFQLSQPPEGTRSSTTSSTTSLPSKPTIGVAPRQMSSSADSPSIISSMLQAPKQIGAALNQSVLQMSSANLVKSNPPLPASLSKTAASENQTETTAKDTTRSVEPSQTMSGMVGKVNVGSCSSLHDQKRLVSRQSSAPPVISQPTSSQVMSALQQRLALPVSSGNQKQIPSQALSGVKSVSQSKDQQQQIQLASTAVGSGLTPNPSSSIQQVLSSSVVKPLYQDTQLSVLTTEHFKSQGLADGLASAARDYANLHHQQCSVETSTQNIAQEKGNQEEKQLLLSSYENDPQIREQIDPRPKLLVLNNSALKARLNLETQENLLKTVEAPMRLENSLSEDKSKDPVSQNMPHTSPSTVPASASGAALISAESTLLSAPEQTMHQQTNPIGENNSSATTIKKKKGRPRGSKNRPKDLNLVLAKAKASTSKSQQSTGSLDMTQGESGGLPGIKQNLGMHGQAGQFLLVQGGQFPKLILPRSSSVTTKPQDTLTPKTPIPVGISNLGVLSAASTLARSPLPMSPVQVAFSPQRAPSSGSAGSTVTATAASNLIGQSILPVVSSSSVGAKLVSGKWIASPAASSGQVVFGFPVQGTNAGTTPLTPVTPTNSGQAASSTQFHILSQGRVRPDLSLNISTSANTVTPRVIPFIPAVTFHNIDANFYSRQFSEGSSAKEQVQGKLSQSTSQPISQLALTPLTPVTPKTPDTPTDFAGTRRKLKERILEKQSLSSDRGSIDSSIGVLKPETPAQMAQILAELTPKAPTVQQQKSVSATSAISSSSSGPHPSVVNKQVTTATNSALLASLTKPVLTSTKLGSKPNAVITSAVMGDRSVEDQQAASGKSGQIPLAETLLRVQSEPDGDHPQHPVVLRAFSETSADPLAKFRRYRPHIPSPLSIEDNNKPARSSPDRSAKLASFTVKEDSQPQHSTKIASLLATKTPRGVKALALSSFIKSKSESSSSVKDSFDSGLGLRSLSQESGQLTSTRTQSHKSFYFSPSLGSVDPGNCGGDGLMIDLSGENFNNVTIPINYGQPYVGTAYLQSGPLLTSWNNPNRATGMHVSLSPVTLAGSKIVLPSVNNGDNLLKETRNWLMKRSICMHRIYQVPSQLWHFSTPNTLDTLTAMAIALGNPSSMCLIRTLLSKPKNLSILSNSLGNIPTVVEKEAEFLKTKLMELTGRPSGAEKDCEIILVEGDELDEADCSIVSVSGLQGTPSSSTRTLPSTPQLRQAVNLELRARLSSLAGKSSQQSLSSSVDSQFSEPPLTEGQALSSSTLSSSGKSRSLSMSTPQGAPQMTGSTYPVSPSLGVGSRTKAAAPGSITYGHQCPTLYTCAHVTFCCIQRPQPVYVAVKNTRRVSMYSNWRLATHNPNPKGLTPRMLLALYRSRTTSDPMYSQCMGTSTGGGNQTHSSYWTFQRRRDGQNKPGKPKLLEKAKSADLNRSSSTDTLPATVKDMAGNINNSNSSTSSSSGSSRKQRLKMSRSAMGFKSDEQYEYVRGRGYGKYVCHRCHIRCKKPSMLKKHLRTHTDLRPYHCRHCRFSFKTKGNLTKHMKSKSHQKKCYELGIIPVPTEVDESQIDSAALQEQVRISREATIQDGTAAPGSGDEGEDDDGEEEEDIDDDDMEGVDDDEDEDKMKSLSASSSFELDTSGLASPRVLKRQSSIDEASPVFTFGQNQQRRSPTPHADSLQRQSDSIDSFYQYRSHSPSKRRVQSPNSMNAEIARSLQDLALPNKYESKEFVDETARQDATHKLQALISRLMSEKKPLSGLEVPSQSDGQAVPLPTTGALLSPKKEEGGPEDDRKHGSTHGLPDKFKEEPTFSNSPLAHQKPLLFQKDIKLSELERLEYKDEKPKGFQRIVDTQVSSLSSFERVASEDEDSVFLPSTSSTSTVKGTVPQSSPARPACLPFIQSSVGSEPSSETRRPGSSSTYTSSTQDEQLRGQNLPNLSLLTFLPAYVSSRQSRRQTADQGPIIGQFVRKSPAADTLGEPTRETVTDIALTPSLVLEGQTHPFQFNIPFPGNNQSMEEEEEEEETNIVMGRHKFLHPIPIVTITGASSGTPSPSFDDSPMAQSPVGDSTTDMDFTPDISQPVPQPATLSKNQDKSIPGFKPEACTSTKSSVVSSAPPAYSSLPTVSFSAFTSVSQSVSVAQPAMNRANITTHTMMQEPLSATSVSSGTSEETAAHRIASSAPLNTSTPSRKERRSSFDKASSRTPGTQTESAVASLVHKSALPFISFTSRSVGLPTGDKVNPTTSVSNVPASNNVSYGYPMARRTRRLSSGKSRFLRRQRSLDDGTAFPTAVFEHSNSQTHGSSSNEKSAGAIGRSLSDRQQGELVKSKSFNHYYTTELDKPSAVNLTEQDKGTKSGRCSPDKTLGSRELLKQTETQTPTVVRVEKQLVDLPPSQTPSSPSQLKEEKEPSHEMGGTEDQSISRCVFCSVDFATKERYQEHLKSRDHIRLLENLGALPAGTFERLQHSEQKVREERKKEDGREREQKGTKQVEMSATSGHHPQSLNSPIQDHTVKLFGQPGTTSETRTSTTTTTRVAMLPTSSTTARSLDGQSSNPVRVKPAGPVHVEEQVVLKASLGREVQLVRRAHSQVDMPSSLVTGRPGRPPLLKRKISMPSSSSRLAESATLLSSPHLNEDLRRSLAKRARQGLFAGSSSSPHGFRDSCDWAAEPDSEIRLVIDEHTLSPSSSSRLIPTRTVTSLPSQSTSSEAPLGQGGFVGSQQRSSTTKDMSIPSKTSAAQAISFASTSKPAAPLSVSSQQNPQTSHTWNQLNKVSEPQSGAIGKSQSPARPVLGFVTSDSSNITNLSRDQAGILSSFSTATATSMFSSSRKTILFLPQPTSVPSTTELPNTIVYPGDIKDKDRASSDLQANQVTTKANANLTDSATDRRALLLGRQSSPIPSSSPNTPYSPIAQTSIETHTSTSSRSLPTSSAMVLPTLTQDGRTGSPTAPSQSREANVATAVSNVTSRQFACGLCELSFLSEDQRKIHVQTHVDLRPHVCEFCDAGFTNSRSLRTHLLTHGQDRPYICGNCGDTFANMSDLQTHYSSHSSTSIASSQWKLETQVPVSQPKALLRTQELSSAAIVGSSVITATQIDQPSYQTLSGRSSGPLSLIQLPHNELQQQQQQQLPPYNQQQQKMLQQSSPHNQQQQKMLQQHQESVNSTDPMAQLKIENLASALPQVTSSSPIVNLEDIKIETINAASPNKRESPLINRKLSHDQAQDDGEEMMVEFAAESMEDFESDQDESGVTAAWEELTKETGTDIFVQDFKVDAEARGYDDDDDDDGSEISRGQFDGYGDNSLEEKMEMKE